jgi:hypothetical protein
VFSDAGAIDPRLALKRTASPEEEARVRAVLASYEFIERKRKRRRQRVDAGDADSSSTGRASSTSGPLAALARATAPSLGDEQLVLQPRFCRKSGTFKPDRAHYCETCGRCSLRLDHHCVAVNNCIGYGNYHWFLMLLLSAVSLCAYVVRSLDSAFAPLALAQESHLSASARAARAAAAASSPLARIARIFDSVVAADDAYVLVVFALALVFGVVFGLFLAFHVYLVATGHTTLEFTEKRGYRDPVTGLPWLSPYAHPRNPLANALAMLRGDGSQARLAKDGTTTLLAGHVFTNHEREKADSKAKRV